MPKSLKPTLECESTSVCQQDRLLALHTIDERLQRYRLVQPKLERLMTQSLKDYGQVSPIIVCELEGLAVLVDGFKRLHAARTLKGLTHLNARTLEVDEQSAKAAMFNLNRVVGRPVELEESSLICSPPAAQWSRPTSCSQNPAKQCGNRKPIASIIGTLA